MGVFNRGDSERDYRVPDGGLRRAGASGVRLSGPSCRGAKDSRVARPQGPTRSRDVDRWLARAEAGDEQRQRLARGDVDHDGVPRRRVEPHAAWAIRLPGVWHQVIVVEADERADVDSVRELIGDRLADAPVAVAKHDPELEIVRPF